MGVPLMALAVSNSTKAYPDIWCNTQSQPPVITVTAEWAKQSTAERRKRLLHELAHIKGLEHGVVNGLRYSTHPSQDSYSRALYDAVNSNPTKWQIPIQHTAGRAMTPQERRDISTELMKLPVRLREKLRRDGAYVETVVNTGITSSPSQSHLRGVTPRGWPSNRTWDSVVGGAVKEQRKIVLVANRLKEGHGSINAVLHEMIHILDRTLSDKSGTDFSESEVWQRFFHDNKDSISSTLSPYVGTYPEEGFAELYSYYLYSKESRERLLRLFPSVEPIFRELAGRKHIVAKKLNASSFTPQMRAAIGAVLLKAWAIESGSGEQLIPVRVQFNPKNLLPPIEWDTKALQRANEAEQSISSNPKSLASEAVQYSISGAPTDTKGTIWHKSNGYSKLLTAHGDMKDVWEAMERYRKEHKLNPEMWSCGVCSMSNAASAKRCKRCGAPRDLRNPFLEYAMMGAGFGAGTFVANKVLDKFGKKRNPMPYPIMPIPAQDALKARSSNPK